MHQVILGLEKLTGMPSTGTVLERYKIIVVDFQERVGRYQSKNPFQRLVHHRKMMSEFERIQGIVTALLQMLSMEMAAEIEDLKQQWKADRCAVNDHLASLLEDASASLLELQDVRDALLLLQNSSAKPVDITMYFDDLQRVGKGSSGTMASESSLGRDNEE
ncbi:hypothetical protein ON010_g10336 [Phytophthora cinnamomi]|nr:hypothetical protein ON010_g10336 [Phytophthora cinnamomi]